LLFLFWFFFYNTLIICSNFEIHSYFKKYLDFKP
jgi:hypothetical protein